MSGTAPRWLAIAPLLLFACGGEEEEMKGTRTDVTTVRFDYRASTEVLHEVESTGCAALVGTTHIHASWRNYNVIRFFPIEASLWAATFHDVPFGSHRIRVSDPNACLMNPTGAVTSTVVFANGVLLTNEVITPGDGPEPGFGFSVGSDGTVVP